MWLRPEEQHQQQYQQHVPQQDQPLTQLHLLQPEAAWREPVSPARPSEDPPWQAPHFGGKPGQLELRPLQLSGSARPDADVADPAAAPSPGDAMAQVSSRGAADSQAYGPPVQQQQLLAAHVNEVGKWPIKAPWPVAPAPLQAPAAATSLWGALAPPLQLPGLTLPYPGPGGAALRGVTSLGLPAWAAAPASAQHWMPSRAPLWGGSAPPIEENGPDQQWADASVATWHSNSAPLFGHWQARPSPDDIALRDCCQISAPAALC